MKNLKNFFKKPKNAIISIVGIGATLLVIGAGTVLAASSIAEGTSIGKTNAQNFAFVDAGVDPSEAKVLEVKFDFECGQFVYEVEFVSNGTKYEYWIKASDGSILKKEMDVSDYIQTSQNTETTVIATNQNKETTGAGTNQNKETTGTTTNTQQQKNTITLNEAKNIALKNAGVQSNSATFTKTKLDMDDGIQVYDIEFYTSTHKYDYEINAKTGAIYTKELEMIGIINNSNNNTNSYIGIDRAKSIALNHSGVSSAEATFKKAQLDREDGMMVYEIEFYKGSIEYEYEINAITGEIRDFDID